MTSQWFSVSDLVVDIVFKISTPRSFRIEHPRPYDVRLARHVQPTLVVIRLTFTSFTPSRTMPLRASSHRIRNISGRRQADRVAQAKDSRLRSRVSRPGRPLAVPFGHSLDCSTFNYDDNSTQCSSGCRTDVFRMRSSMFLSQKSRSLKSTCLLDAYGKRGDSCLGKL